MEADEGSCTVELLLLMIMRAQLHEVRPWPRPYMRIAADDVVEDLVLVEDVGHRRQTQSGMWYDKVACSPKRAVLMLMPYKSLP
ncbi:MAG: hypothetical protein HC773_20440 [Scytonema sp. CRU_2_7]|nr:hypothetical protein [Scytonema sp. CRU_2_7]